MYLAGSPPPSTQNQAQDIDHDEVLVYMVGELYDDAESSSATSSDHGTVDDGDLQVGNDAELAHFRYRRAKREW